MKLIDTLLTHWFGPREIIPRYLDQTQHFHTLDGDWVLQKVRYEETRLGLKFGAIELSPVKVVGYGYRVVTSPRPVHPNYVHHRNTDLQRALEKAELGMRIADRERMENGLLFKDTFLRHS